MAWKYLNIGKANEEIRRLERELAKLTRADAARPPELEALATLPQAGKAPAMAATSTGTLTRKQLVSLAAVFPMLDDVTPAKTDQQLRAEVAKAAYQAHHDIAGLTDDAGLTGKLWRTEQPKGLSKYMHALRQTRIDAILKK